MNVPTKSHEGILDESCIGELAHIKRLYAMEKQKPLKLAPKLKKWH